MEPVIKVSTRLWVYRHLMKSVGITLPLSHFCYFCSVWLRFSEKIFPCIGFRFGISQCGFGGTHSACAAIGTVNSYGSVFERLHFVLGADIEVGLSQRVPFALLRGIVTACSIGAVMLAYLGCMGFGLE